MDDSLVNGILHLAKLKMGLPLVDGQPDSFFVHVTLGDQTCILTHEELKSTKLNLPQNLNTNVDLNSHDCKEFENSNQEQPLNLSVKEEPSSDVEAQDCGPTSLDGIKVEKCEHEDATGDRFSNVVEVPDNPPDEQVTSEHYYASAESNDSSNPREQVSTEPSSSKEPGEDVKVAPETSQISVSAVKNETTVDDSTKVEGKKEHHSSKVDLGNNQKHNWNRLAPMRRCHFCQEVVFHSSWNCPKKRGERDKNKYSPWAPFSNNNQWRPQYKPHQRLWPRNNHFNSAPSNFGQKDHAPAKRGTFRRVYEMLQNSNRVETKNQPPKTRRRSKKACSAETNNRHKMLFQGEWYTNRTAADAELYLNKKEEVSLQIKEEHRNLDEGFEDIQIVLSDDENPYEDPTFAYNKLQKHFKDEDNDAGGSSASFSTAA